MLRLFKCILSEFVEDLSDRKRAFFLQKKNAATWFCGFSLSESMPDHNIFCRYRKQLDTQFISKILIDLRMNERAF